ncbi:MAG: GGDEF domain-containing protein [Aurantimonas coralicida]|nr:GGDEF domain-containing protein [Aurantimonas coralicida]
MGEASNVAMAAAIRGDDYAASGTAHDRPDRSASSEPRSTCPVLEKTARRLRSKLASERTARRIVSDLLERRTGELRQMTQDLERRLADQSRELRSARKQASRLADYDPLTGAGTRRHFHSCLQALGETGGGTHTLLVLLDMDDFRSVNDCVGHRIGDEVLRLIVMRLRGTVRKADYVARLGGDEFAVLCCDVDGPEAAEELCKRLYTAMQAPFRMGEHTVPLTCSMGAVTVGSPCSTRRRSTDLPTSPLALPRSGGVHISSITRRR